MTILKGIGKILFGMHLWLPLSYSVVFLVLAAVTGTLEGAWPYYFIGLSVSLVASIVLVYLTASVKKRNSASDISANPVGRDGEPLPPPITHRSDRPSSRKEEYARYEDEAARIYEEQMRYSGQMNARPNNIGAGTYVPQSDYTRPSESPRPPYRPAPSAEQRRSSEEALYGNDAVGNMNKYYGTKEDAHDALYSSFSSAPVSTAERAPSGSHGGFSPYVQPSNIAPPDSPRVEDYSSRRAEEKPKIFRTRKEPNVLVYEYSDRYERYYLGKDGSQTLIGRESK